MTVCNGIITCSGIYDYWAVLTIWAAMMLTLHVFTNRKWSISVLLLGWITWLFVLENFFTFIFFEKPIWSILNILYVAFFVFLTYLSNLNVKENSIKSLIFIWVIGFVILAILLYVMFQERAAWLSAVD